MRLGKKESLIQQESGRRDPQHVPAVARGVGLPVVVHLGLVDAATVGIYFGKINGSVGIEHHGIASGNQRNRRSLVSPRLQFVQRQTGTS